MKTTIEQIRARDGARAFRAAEVGAINEEKRTVELAFSSEVEVSRWYGLEVLSHDPAAVVLTRLKDGAPLLLEHDCDDQIGVVESVSIDADRRGRAVVRFGKSALAEEIFQDVKDGIRRHVSVGYIVHDAKLTEERDGMDVWTITSWEPFEISIVAVPADVSVGIGRKLESPQEETRNAPLNNPENFKEPEIMETKEISQVDNATELRKATDAERARTRSILEMGEKYGAAELARDAVKEGMDVAAFQRQLLDHVNGKIQRPLAEQMNDATVGLSDKEARSFSFMKVIRALAEPTDSRAQKDAAFEFEASRAAADKLGKDSDKFVIPVDVLTRALNTGKTGTAAGDTGGYGIATTLMAESFIDILRNRATIMQLGTVMGGLVGNIDIPKQVAAAQGYWIGEDADATESNLELGQLSLTPKTVAAFSEITRKLMVQSSVDVEALVRADLAKALALTIDRAGYYGSGSDHQPLGIANQSGVNAVTFAGAQPTFAELVQMETEVALQNADVSSMAYVGNAAFRGHGKTTLKFPGVNGSGTIWEPGNTVNGYRTEVTNQINTGDVFMGNFADLLVAMWGGLELLVDPYSNSKKGRLRVVVFQDVDFALRRTQSFCVGRPD
ncbi:phage major capsid protein [Microvirga alba]|uniref:Phage major capsid protein n=1 Tax=Microvirga alba TaxID=2791025 RepID=A0A931FRB4_9HYPH|nr:phage major capsid protein [Microvirga alba]MBF9235582.1 phage major capsid protein [Microvirga alba]